MSVKRVNRASIDVSKWNALIKQSHNSLPYGYAWYLDAVSENWEALILNDYEAVLPLPFVKKMGFKLYVQPLFCQQLGPFSLDPLSEEEIINILDHLPKKALRLNLSFSTEITIPDKFSFLNPKKRINQLIKLHKSIDQIKDDYRRTSKRKLKNHGHKYSGLEEIQDPKEVIGFYKQQLESQVHLKEKGYSTALKLFIKAIEMNSAYCYKFKNKENNEWVSKGLVILDENRVINLFSATKKSAKGANAKNIDLLLEKFHSSKKVFDFEGSSLSGVNQFFNSFGPQTTFYYSIDKVHPILNLAFKLKALINK